MLFVDDAAQQLLSLWTIVALYLSLMSLARVREAVRRILTIMMSWFPVCGGLLMQGLQQVVDWHIDILDLQPPSLDLEPEPVDTSPSTRSPVARKRFQCTGGYPQSLRALHLEESPELPETAPSQTAPTPTETTTAHEADTTVVGSEKTPPWTPPRHCQIPGPSATRATRRLEMHPIHAEDKGIHAKAWEERYLRTGCPHCGMTDKLNRQGSSHLGRNLWCMRCHKQVVWVSFH